MRWYRALLSLYPASFRAEYGEEMAAIHRLRLRDAGGGPERLLAHAAAFQEVVMTAPAVHWDIFKQDMRYTLRTLRRAPGFALTAIMVVALGIGANSAAFSVTDFVLLRPLPFPDADRLVTIWQRSPGYSQMELAPANIIDWRAAAASFERVGIYRAFSGYVLGHGDPVRVVGAAVNSDLLPALGVRPALGRAFAEGEDGRTADRVVVLSHTLWQAAFGGDSGVIGRKILLDDDPYTVIGVMPAGFTYPGRESELWVPLRLSPEEASDRTNNEFYAVARLQPGVTLAGARAEMELLAAQSRAQYPKENENTGVAVNELRADLVSEQSRTMVKALSGAAFAVLLIVCANLANLLLARAVGRQQELAVRTAMGAGRERLVRQLATESVVISLLGGAVGLLLAAAVVPLLWSLVPTVLPTTATPAIDVRVMAFAAVLTFVTALTFSLVPMMRTGAAAGVRGLREGARAIGGGKERLRGALVIAEVGASVLLLVVTGLLLRALFTVQARDSGFRAEGVLTMRTDFQDAKYVATSRRAEFYNRLLGEIRTIPGVTNAAYISGLPMVWGGGIWPVGINGVELERRENNTATMRFVTPGFFATMNIPILRGRDVSDSDTMSSERVAVVSASFVRRYWPDQDPRGRHFNFAGDDRTIVGVAGDIRVRGLERDSEPQVYLPYRQVADGRLWGYVPRELVISATVPLAPIVPTVRAIVRANDPQLPILHVRPMTDIVGRQTATRTVQVRVLAGFALVAFLLAAIGIHGVLSFAVSQRTSEIGVRIALGAQRRDILAMVAARGVQLVAVGLALGVALAYYAGRWLQALLAGISPLDLSTYGAAIGLTAVMALAGTLLPTLRALRVDPIKAIRAE
jgi:putative ABC transport system permease protein